MKIKKIYIENFKGIKEGKLLDFESGINLLTGPNGFGKTTSFDVLELCLTGKINRSISKASTTDQRNNYPKPLYQNTTDKRVLIQVLLENEKGEKRRITKFLPENNSGKNTVRASFEDIETYISAEEKINDQDFGKKQIQQQIIDNINQFLSLKDGASIENIYLIFNYIQQEEVLFFLKQSESDRKKNFDFIFNIEKEKNELNRIKETHDKLKDILSKLKEKKNKLDTGIKEEREKFDKKIKEREKEIQKPKSLDVTYEVLFAHKEDCPFDKEAVFQDKTSENIDQYKQDYEKTLLDLEEFRLHFSPSDFENKQKKIKLGDIIKNKNFIDFLLFEKFLADEPFEKIRKEKKIIDDENLLKSFLLKDLITKLEKFKEENKKIENLKSFIEYTDREEKINWIEKNEKAEDLKTFQKEKSEQEKFSKIEGQSDDVYRNHIFRDLVEKLPELTEYQENIRLKKDFLDKKTEEEKIDWIISCLGNKKIDLEEYEFLIAFPEKITKKKHLDSSLEETKQHITHLKDFREKTHDLFIKSYKSNKNVPEKECPYCGTSYEDFESLDRDYAKKTDELRKIEIGKGEDILQLGKEIANTISQLEKEFQENKEIDKELFFSFEESNSFNIDIFEGCNLSAYVWNASKLKKSTSDDLKESIKNMRNEIQKQRKKSQEYLNAEVERIEKESTEYLEKNQKIDEELLSQIESLKNQERDFSMFENEKFKKFIWTEERIKEKTKDHLFDDIKSLKDFYKQDTHWNDENYQKIEDLKSGEDFSENKKYVIQNTSIETFEEWSIENWHELTTEKHHSLKEKIESEQNKYIYEEGKTIDSKAYFKDFFSNDKSIFEKITPEKISLKKRYIHEQFLIKTNSFAEEQLKKENDKFSEEEIRQKEVLSRYNERCRKLSEIVSKINSLKDEFEKTIKTYKSDMVGKIKIPFFLYTAKILQNYQQGMGVYIDIRTKEDSSENPTDAIVFLTDPFSKHDAVHHLSSGQLSTVALAFTFAVNKSYKISENLKFLAIDDPIQEMDALNIHSFIELLRHEFLGNNYQLLMSTHDDSNALFMKYKFEKMGDRGKTKMINVQNEFFG